LNFLLLCSMLRRLTIVPTESITDSFKDISTLPKTTWKLSRPTTSIQLVNPKRNSTTLISVLLLRVTLKLTPGPKHQASIYPCGLLEYPVTWNCEGVCCDECNVWHHRSGIELCSKDYHLHHCNVQWLCCKCDSMNITLFTFHNL
jgi:hypothetical protein